MASMDATASPSGSSRGTLDSQVQLFGQSQQESFRRLVSELAAELDDKKSRENVAYLYKDKLGPKRKKKTMSMLAMMEKLQEKGVYSSQNVDGLNDLLDKCGRLDLIESHVNVYCQKITTVTNDQTKAERNQGEDVNEPVAVG